MDGGLCWLLLFVVGAVVGACVFVRCTIHNSNIVVATMVASSPRHFPALFYFPWFFFFLHSPSQSKADTIAMCGPNSF